MTNDELQAMVRDELFWVPGSAARRSPWANEGEVTL